MQPDGRDAAIITSTSTSRYTDPSDTVNKLRKTTTEEVGHLQTDITEPTLLPFVSLTAGPLRLCALVDTGASVSFINKDFCEQYGLTLRKSLQCYDVRLPTGERITTSDELCLALSFGGTEVAHTFVVMSLQQPCILGCDFLDKYQATLDFDANQLTLVVEGRELVLPMQRVTSEESMADSQGEGQEACTCIEVSYKQFRKEMNKKDVQVFAVHVRSVADAPQQSSPEPTSVELSTLTVQPNAVFTSAESQLIAEFLSMHKSVDQFSGCEIQSLVDVWQPSLNMMQNSLHVNSDEGREAFARQYQRTRFDWTKAVDTPLVRGQILMDVKVQVTDLDVLAKMLALQDTLWVSVSFISDSPRKLEEVKRLLPKHVLLPSFGQTAVSNVSSKADSPLEFLQDTVYAEPGLPEGSVGHLLRCPEEYQQQLRTLLREYAEVFPKELPKRVPPNRGLGDEMCIDLEPGTKPIKQKMYRQSPAEQLAIKKQLDELLAAGLIQPSHSEWGAPVLFAKKPDGSLRFCTDYRALNKVTVRDRYPLPRHEELFNRLGHAKFFSSLDLRSGYWHIRIADKDVHKSAFQTRYGLFEWKVVPFGLTNAPSVFMRVMNRLFEDMLDTGVVVFLDDILVYSKDAESHFALLQKVVQRLQDFQFYCKLKKCSFLQTKTAFLGFDVTADGVSVSTSKVAAVQAWPRPTTAKQVQSFIGLAQFFRRFVKGFSGVVEPLTRLTRKDVPFVWNEEQENAFAEIKQRLCSPPVLAIFEATPGTQWEVHTDASATAIGAVLLQKRVEEKAFRPVEYFSRKLSSAQQNYSPTDREMHAIVESLRYWRGYLAGSTFLVRTDHQPLEYFFSQPKMNGRQLRWAAELADFLPGLSIVHIKGKENRVPDALSRRPDLLATLATSPTWDFLPQLRDKQEEDPSLATYLRQADNGHPDFTKQDMDGQPILLFRQRIVVPSVLVPVVLSELHDKRGHFGQKRTLRMVQERFWWPRMAQTIKQYCQECSVCQRAKSDTQRPAGLYSPLPIPAGPWEQIHMDFVTDLPMDAQCTTVLTIVDRFSKMCHFLPLANTDAPSVAQAFFTNIVAYHGLPKVIVSDRDPRFTSQFWTALMAAMRTELHFSTAFHPQTDGLAEVSNRTLGQLLRLHCGTTAQWVSSLPLLALLYNATPHSRSQLTPYFMAYGRNPVLPIDLAISEIPVPAAASMLSHLQDLWTLVQQRATATADADKQRADAARRSSPISVGDLVLLSTRNLHLRSSPGKLKPRYVGPFRVLSASGRNAFRLALPDTMRVHPVFNVSLLRPFHGTYEPPGPIYVDGEAEYEVERILRHRGSGRRRQYLIRWTGYDASEDCWLRETDLSNAPDILAAYKRRFGLP